MIIAKGSYHSPLEPNKWFINNVSINCLNSNIINMELTVHLLQC